MLLGADPELLLSKNGELVSAEGLIPGDKLNPFKVPKGAIQVDGVAAEFNIDPASTLSEFKENLFTVIEFLKEKLSSVTIEKEPAMLLPASYKKKITSEALRIGCNADVNAYSEELNEGPAEDIPFRAAGGHIHVGLEEICQGNEGKQFANAMRMSRLMDRFLGVYSLIWDSNPTRRLIYGKAGACRPKPYGVEYRTLSNMWVFNEAIIEFVWNQSEKAVNAFLAGEDVLDQTYANIINNNQINHEILKTTSEAIWLRKNLDLEKVQ